MERGHYGPQPLPDSEFRICLSQHSRLIESASPVLEWLGTHAGAPFTFAVATRELCLLEVRSPGENLPPGVFPGADWGGAAAGCWAGPEALRRGEPCQVQGTGHDWPELHPWTSLAAPIDGDGLSGLLLAWAPVQAVHPHTLAMLGAAALSAGVALRERRQADRLQTLLRYQAAIVESVSDGLLTLDAEGVVTYMNPAAGRILGMDHKASVGRHVSDLVGFRPVILDVLRTGEGYTDREFVLRDSVRSFHFIKTAIPIRDESGRLTGVVDAFREIHKVRQMVNRLTGAQARFTFDDFIGRSPSVQECLAMARIAARSSSNVLIMGESGTGKEVLAQAIHNASSYADGPFVAVNCGAIPRELIEGELFGAEEGAFTGAPKGGRPGKFELANGGTIFLDEIGEMPPDMQVKLLRVLQERRLTRLGGKYEMEVRCRVIAATNHDLLQDVRDGAFRRDLFYRLNVFSLSIPPLSQRIEDLPLLVESLLTRLSRKLGRPFRAVSQEVMTLLSRHSWPGNVRELENALERAANVAEGDLIEGRHLHLRSVTPPPRPAEPFPVRAIAELELEAVQEAVRACGGNISRAARLLGLSRNTVYAKLRAGGAPALS